MKRLAKVSGLCALSLFALSFMIPLGALAQVDSLGKVDTIYADVSRVNEYTYTITVSYTNDETVEGLTVPLRMSAGLNRVVADSAVYTGGRVDHFALKVYRPDTAAQAVLLGMVANLSPTNNKLDAGRGRLATIFVSSLEKKPIDSLVVDTTTLPPSKQSLISVASMLQGEPPDTVRLTTSQVRLQPAFVCRYVN